MKKSKLITVRELMFDDLLKIKEWRNQQINILRQNRKLTDKDQEKYWEKIKNSKEEKLFAINNKKGNLIGYGGLVNIDNENKKAEISFLLDTKIEEGTKKYSKIFLEFLKYIVDHGFGEMNLTRIFTETYEFRNKHMQILERAGFKKEGLLRSNVIKKGRSFDSLIHSIINKE